MMPSDHMSALQKEGQGHSSTTADGGEQSPYLRPAFAPLRVRSGDS
jgi:hypothetical protein